MEQPDSSTTAPAAAPATNATAPTNPTPTPTTAASFVALRDPRYIQGRALIKAKKYDAGIDCMCELLEALVATFGGDHLETTPVLFEYGSALLLKAESTANLFGDAVEDAAADKDSNAPALTGIEKAQRAAAESSATAEDLEIAWEVLEVSRVILNKNLNNVHAQLLLARVHLRLGDHEVDNGQLVDAIRDYSACLKLRLAALAVSDRRLADAHTSLAMAHVSVGVVGGVGVFGCWWQDRRTGGTKEPRTNQEQTK